MESLNGEIWKYSDIVTGAKKNSLLRHTQGRHPNARSRFPYTFDSQITVAIMFATLPCERFEILLEYLPNSRSVFHSFYVGVCCRKDTVKSGSTNISTESE